MSVRRVEHGSEGTEAAAAMDEIAAERLAGLARHFDGAQVHAIASALADAESAMSLINLKGLPFGHRRQFQNAIDQIQIVRAALSLSR